MNRRVKQIAHKTGKYVRLLQNTAILSIGTFGSKLLVFLLLPLYTSYLSAAEYGIADLITNFANFLIPIFCCGVSEGVLRFSLREKTADGAPRYERKSVFSTCIAIALCGSAVLLCLLPLFLLYPSLSAYGILVVLYVISSNFHSIAAEYVRACEKTSLYAFQGVLNTFLVIALNLILLLGFDAGLYGYVFSVILADLFTTVFLFFFARLYREFSFANVRKATAKALLKFSLPLIPGTILWWIISVSDRYVLMWISGEEINGLYVAAAKIPTILTLLCTVFLTAWKNSAVIEESGDGEEEKRRKGEFFGQVYGGFSAFLFCLAAGITLFSKIFSKILFSEAFYTAWQFIPILTFGCVFYNLARFLGSVYFVNQKSIRSSLTALAAAVINVVLNLLLIPKFGGIGAATATAVAYFVEAAVRSFDAEREMRFSTRRLHILISGALLLAEVIVVTIAPTYWIPIASVLTIMMILLWGKQLFAMVKNILGMLKRRSLRKSS